MDRLAQELVKTMQTRARREAEGIHRPEVGRVMDTDPLSIRTTMTGVDIDSSVLELHPSYSVPAFGDVVICIPMLDGRWWVDGPEPGAAPVPGVILPGMMIEYGGTSAPTGYLLCDGSAVNRTTYAALFAAIGVTHGPGDGSTTFNIPDKRGRVSLGSGTGSGLTARTAGANGGFETHTLTTSQLASHTHTGPSHTHTGPAHTHTGPSHTHTTPDHTHSVAAHVHPGVVEVVMSNTGGSAGANNMAVMTGGTVSTGLGGFSATSSDNGGNTGSAGTGATSSDGTGATGSSGTGATGSAGSDGSHNNMQPFVVVTHIIRT